MSDDSMFYKYEVVFRSRIRKMVMTENFEVINLKLSILCTYIFTYIIKANLYVSHSAAAT
jgi:hypothetical protein